MSLKEADIGWLACALDGEGSCSLGERRDGNPFPVVTIASSSALFREKGLRVAGSVGCRFNTNNGKTTTYLRTQSLPDIRALLSAILPHLTTKAALGCLMLDFVSRRLARGARRGLNLPFTEDELALARMISWLNGGKKGGSDGEACPS